MAMAPPPACSLLLRVAAAAPSFATSNSVLTSRGPGLLPSPRPASARRHLTAAWSPKAAASASVEIQDDYADEMDAVNIAQDVTQVHGRFPSLPLSHVLYSDLGMRSVLLDAPGRCFVVAMESADDD